MPASRETIGWRLLMVIMKVLRQFAWVRTQTNCEALTKVPRHDHGHARPRTAPPGHDGKRIYRSLLKRSATAGVAALISLSSLSRFARTALSSVLTVTFSKKASTCGRSLAIALMAAAKSSLATAPEAPALAISIALASARSSAWP